MRGILDMRLGRSIRTDRAQELLDLWSLDLAAAVDWNAEEEAESGAGIRGKRTDLRRPCGMAVVFVAPYIFCLFCFFFSFFVFCFFVSSSFVRAISLFGPSKREDSFNAAATHRSKLSSWKSGGWMGAGLGAGGCFRNFATAEVWEPSSGRTMRFFFF